MARNAAPNHETASRHDRFPHPALMKRLTNRPNPQAGKSLVISQRERGTSFRCANFTVKASGKAIHRGFALRRPPSLPRTVFQPCHDRLISASISPSCLGFTGGCAWPRTSNRMCSSSMPRKCTPVSPSLPRSRSSASSAAWAPAVKPAGRSRLSPR